MKLGLSLQSKRAFGRLPIILLLAGYASSQTFYSDLSGTVTDSSGSAVPEATLVLTSVGTNESHTRKTDDSGNYTFSELRPGNYVLNVKKDGFQQTTISNLILVVNQHARQDIALKLGQVNEQVTVEATGIMLESDNATLGQVIQQKSIEDMPLNGRNFVQLAQLSVGVIPIVTGMTSPSTTWTGRSDQVIAVAGSRETDTSYLLDGIETRNPWYGSVGIRPSVEAIQEFNIQRNTFSAEFGWGAAVVNTTLRSGSNELHGSLYEYLRNNKMDARNFFDYGTGPIAPKPPFHQNQFGSTLGGPIVRNKVFYFFNYEGLRQILDSTSFGRFPTPQQLQGNFSGLPTIIDPATGAPFPGNIIPSTRFSTVAKNYVQFFPAPNYQLGAYNYVGILRNTSGFDQTNARIDYNIRERDSIFGRYTWSDESEYKPGLPPDSGNSWPQSDVNAVLAWTHLLNPSATNDFRVGYNQSKTGIQRDGAFSSTNIAASVLGIANLPDRPSSFGLPSTSFTNYTGVGPTQGTNQDRDRLFQISEALSITRGKHFLKIGAEIRRDAFYMVEDSRANTIGFTGVYSKDATADLLLGLPYTAQVSYGDPTGNFRRTLQAYYVQDDFKISGRLTLNLGLRYEYGAPPFEIRGHQAVFDPTLVTWVTHRQQPCSFVGCFPVSNVLPASLAYPDRNNWAPRVGLAWRPFGDKFSIRTAYGLYYLFSDYNQQFQQILNPVFYQTVTYGPFNTPLLNLNNLFQQNGTAAIYGSTEDPHQRTPYMHQYNFTLQYLVTNNTVLELGYEGESAHKLPQRTEINAGQPDPTGTIPLANRVEFPQWSAGIVASLDEGNSSYNALTARIEKRLSKGFSAIGSYTYSKCLDYGMTDEFTGNPLNLRNDRGQCTTDIRQRLVASYIYELPIGRGKALGANWSGFLNATLGNWEVSGITTFSTGPYISPVPLVTPNMGRSVSVRANRVGPVNNSALRSGIRSGAITGPYFDVQDIANQIGNTYGSAARDFILCPGLNNWSISLFKNIPIRERTSLQFRSEFFNAFNHAQFGPPNATAGGAFVGQITTAAAPRDIQLSLKLVF
ncbi:MAG TPA: TonB-dependent receptor [Bryobacteraceae bacterium]|nr:TonB-dependent receptor [Bryobacteraceae bacterium]